MIKQLSVFVENRNGAIMEVTGILGEAHIDLRAMSIADSKDFGVVRLLLDEPEAAKDLLKQHGITSSMTNVIGVEVEDKPGAFHEILTVLFEAEIMIEYTYAFLSQKSGKAYAILRVQNEDRAEAALRQAGLRLLDPAEVYHV